MSKKKIKSPVNRDKLVAVYREALASDLSLDKIDQKVDKLSQRLLVSQTQEESVDKKRIKNLKKKLPKAIRFGALVLPFLFIIVGFSLIGSAVLPIFSFYVNTLPDLNSSKLQAPVPDYQVLDITPLVIAHGAGVSSSDTTEEMGVYSGPIIIDQELDYTNLNNWFEDGSNMSELADISLEGVEDEFILEIPKLKILNATVKVGGSNLDKSLIQYPGTALPGKLGSPVIFGHSILRQFYNPSEKNSRRYNSIFSTIMTLEKDDKIYLTHGSVKYTYVVAEKMEVKPTDTYILAQNYEGRTLKLVTCVPEGTYLRRGVVVAQLVRE
jgi:LPXTG-site transpeptidase (sortase) family protein